MHHHGKPHRSMVPRRGLRELGLGFSQSANPCRLYDMDPSIIFALDVSNPPTRPPLVEERPWRSSEAEAVKRHVDRQLTSYSAEIARWSEHLRQHRIRSEAIPYEELREGDFGTLDTLISDLESAAEIRAKNLARSIKRARRDIKAAFEVDPSLGAVLRSAERRLHDIEEQVIEEMLEHALFVRAFKADRDPASRGGPIFDDPSSLAHYLAQRAK